MQTNKESRIRILALFLGLFALFSLLILRFYQLQVEEQDKWVHEAKLQHKRVVLEPFKRGIFYANEQVKDKHPREPEPFVIDVQKFHLYIDPSQIPQEARDPMANHLKILLGLGKEGVEELLQEFGKKSRSRRIAMWLDGETKKKILSWWQSYAKEEKILKNSLFFVSDYQRSYPNGHMLGQVLHTIRDYKDERTREGLPTGGLEMQFNEYLKGRQGKKLLVHSPRHPLEMGCLLEAPEDGCDIYLTINEYLQAIAEEEIEKGVVQARAKSGWALMMDPYTGQILALAQYPFFDPSRYREFFNDPIAIEHTKVKAITDANEVGSVMKPLTLACALIANQELAKEGKPPLFSFSDKIKTETVSFPGRNKPLKDTHIHHFLNAEMAIQKSSNVYVGLLADKIVKNLGAPWYRRVLGETFGFGQKTGIELPGETCGLLPRIGKKHANGTLEWSSATPYSLAMGHNIQATSLQMVRAFSILANGGFLVQPTLVRKIVKKGQVIFDNERRAVMQKRVLNEEITKAVVRCMKYSTKPGGTARKADIWGYTEAGKTGTAEKVVGGSYSKSCYFSSFIGFAPLCHPRFVLLIAIDEPEPVYISGVGKNHHGGTCATRVFRAIGQRTLEYLGVDSDDPHGYPVGDPRYDASKADWQKEREALEALYKAWNE